MDTTLRNAETLARHRRILVRMLFKVTAYYIVLAGAVAIAAATIPGFAQQMPLGGVGEIADVGSSSSWPTGFGWRSAHRTVSRSRRSRAR